MKETSLTKTPPALPDRSRSVGEFTVNKPDNRKSQTSPSTSSDTMDEHYAHLHKHVKEVRRRKKTEPSSPKLSEFQEKENDNIVSTKWVEFIEAWIRYFVASAAYDNIDRPLEPLSLSQVKDDIDRLYPMIAPFIQPAIKIRSIYRWENKALTGGLASLYVILWWYDLILAFMCTWLAIAIAWVRLDAFAQYGIDALEGQPETDATVKSWDKSFWLKMRTSMAKKPMYKGFDLLDDLNISEWRNSIYTQYGPIVQLVLSDTVDYLERIKNLVTWKRPAKTRFLLIMVLGSSFVLTILPLKLIGKMLFLYIGIEFFVLQALRSYYPRHRKLFNVLNLLLWDVPNDAEYALEVVRLNGNNRKSASTSATTTATESPSRPSPQKLSVSTSEIPTSKDITLGKTSETPKSSSSSFQEAAASAATTLTMLAAAAVVNKVKKSIDDRKKRKQELENEIPSDEDTDAFGCLYRGTIPGRIGIREYGFVFQTSLMSGSNTIVECAYADVIGIKKTKQYDMLVWHSNGIDISLADNTTLRFENVLRRDECFNHLLAASGDDDGKWKKM